MIKIYSDLSPFLFLLELVIYNLMCVFGLLEELLYAIEEDVCIYTSSYVYFDVIC